MSWNSTWNPSRTWVSSFAVTTLGKSVFAAALTSHNAFHEKDPPSMGDVAP